MLSPYTTTLRGSSNTKLFDALSQAKGLGHYTDMQEKMVVLKGLTKDQLISNQ
jgi:hypothetical protein